MKKILFILMLFLVFLFGENALACAIPPDILHEFHISKHHEKTHIQYSLFSWNNLKNPIISTLEKESGEKIDKNLEKILETTILKNTKFSLNNNEIPLKFLTGTLINSHNLDDIPNILLTATFEADFSLSEDKINTANLDFDKSLLLPISPLIHPYILADFQKNNTPFGYVFDKNGKIFDEYEKNNEFFVAKSHYDEGDFLNHFSLIFGTKTDEFQNPNQKEIPSQKENIAYRASQDTSEKIDIFSPGKTLKNFFGHNISLPIQIFGIVIAIISGMAHGLLPGHSKSLLVAYVANSGNINKKHLLTLIFSVTFSHTIFIVLLAGMVIFLEKGTSFSAKMIGNIGGILYGVFGIFFVLQAFKWLRKSKKIENFGHHFHHNTCNCCRPKSTKNTIVIGFLAGLVPCIDALALFVAALSIGNIFYSSLLILSFSLGIGIMLAILAFSLNSGKDFLHKKGNIFAEKISHILTLFAGIFLIIMGISHFF